MVIDLESIFTVKELKNHFGDLLPVHVGLILDGNRRWVRKHGLKDSLKGHNAGYTALTKILEPMFNLGIKYLSIYALSTENLAKRSSREIQYIFKMLLKGIQDFLDEPRVGEFEPRFRIIGRIHELPTEIQEAVEKMNKATAHYSKCFINVCINYDGQLEIVDAVKSLIQKGISPDKITKESVKKYLYTQDFPEVDYIIRTGMEDGARISGFLLWDASYAEFQFRDDLWPDYTPEMMIEDMKEYIHRNRRRGK
jgi:undecaprenyl diphosphate synthase